MLTIRRKQGTAVSLVALLTLVLSSTALASGPSATLTMSIDPPAPGQALVQIQSLGIYTEIAGANS
jgi:hypothetical protein